MIMTIMMMNTKAKINVDGTTTTSTATMKKYEQHQKEDIEQTSAMPLDVCDDDDDGNDDLQKNISNNDNDDDKDNNNDAMSTKNHCLSDCRFILLWQRIKQEFSTYSLFDETEFPFLNDNDEEDDNDKEVDTNDDDTNKVKNENDETQKKKKKMMMLDNYKNFNVGTTITTTHDDTASSLPSSSSSSFHHKRIILIKFFLWCMTVGTLMGCWFKAVSTSFFMAYWSHWIFSYSAVYQTLSLLTSLIPSSTTTSDVTATTSTTSSLISKYLIRMTWLFFSIAGVHQITLVLIFWPSGLYKDADMSYRFVFVHVGAMVITLIDGLIVNRTIPVRLNHIWINMFLGILYIAWSIIHGLVVEVNPILDDDGAIYAAVNWRDNLGISLFFSLGILFLVIPLSTFLLWILSWNGRKYVTIEHDNVKNKNDDDNVDCEAQPEETCSSSKSFASTAIHINDCC